jgi:hypothetical protein
MLLAPADPHHPPFASSACRTRILLVPHVPGGARREPVVDLTTTMRVSRSARATHSPSFPFFLSSFRSPVWSRAAKASALRALTPTPLSSFQTPHTRLYASTVAAPKSRSPGLHLERLRDTSWKTRLHFYPTHSPSSPTCLFRDISTLMLHIYRLSIELKFRIMCDPELSTLVFVSGSWSR